MTAQRWASIVFLPAHLAREPRLRQIPIPVHPLWRNTKNQCNLAGCEATEVTHLNHPRYARIKLGTLFQRFVQPDDLRFQFRRNHQTFVEIDGPHSPATFRAATRSGMLNQNTAHDFRNDGEELRSLLPVHLPYVDQPQVRFMHERGCLDRVLGTLPAQAAARNLPQLGIRQVDDSGESTLVAAAPPAKKIR